MNSVEDGEMRSVEECCSDGGSSFDPSIEVNGGGLFGPGEPLEACNSIETNGPAMLVVADTMVILLKVVEMAALEITPDVWKMSVEAIGAKRAMLCSGAGTHPVMLSGMHPVMLSGMHPVMLSGMNSLNERLIEVVVDGVATVVFEST